MLAALVAALALAGPLPAGETSFTVLAGRPFYSVRVDHGLAPGFDIGAGADISLAGFFRPIAQGRLRAFQRGPLQISLRAAFAYIVPTLRADGFGPRRLARTGDGELGLAFEWTLRERIALFAEAAALGETDLKAEHTASFAQGLLGAGWSTGGPLSLVARGGILLGAHGRAGVGSAGAAWRF